MTLTAKDQLKLLNAGFTIIRADNEKLKIKAKTKERPEWYYFEGTGPFTFGTKTGMRKRMDYHLTKPFFVEV